MSLCRVADRARGQVKAMKKFKLPSMQSTASRGRARVLQRAVEQTRGRPPLLLLVALCVVTFLLSWVVGVDELPTAGSALKWFLVVIVMHWLAVFLHEAGHAGFGLAQGMTLKQFAVGPLLIDWSKGPAQVRYNGLRGLNGGYGRFSGENVGTNSSVRAHFWMTLGGPAASLLFGIILLEMGSLMSGDSGWLKYGLIFSGLWAIAVAVINLVPLRNGLSRSDGSWLLALARDGDDARELIAAIYWMDLLNSLTPPAKWPFEVVQAQEDALFRSTTITENQLDLAIVAAVLLYY